MPNAVLTEAIDALAAGTDLSAEQTGAVLQEIMEGSASEVQTAGFLVALRAKGETVDELVGLARTMRELATAVVVDRDDLLDTAGTGGGASTFNVSTVAAFIAAGAGAHVAKHGNRSATSLCGSADVLEALGARIDLAPEAISECIESVGIGFMFAPQHHAATRFVVPVRKELGVRTIFNFLGPLTNPAAARFQLVGVSDPKYVEILAKGLLQLGSRRAMVVSSQDGLDEISVSAPTHVAEVSEEGTKSYLLNPEEMGVSPASLDDLVGGGPEENAKTVRDLLAGKAGPKQEIAIVNAAAALYVVEKVDNLQTGVAVARQAIESGAALKTLDSFIAETNELAPRER